MAPPLSQKLIIEKYGNSSLMMCDSKQFINVY